MTSLLEQKPTVTPPLDPDYRPAILGVRAYEQVVQAGDKQELVLALERENGYVSRFKAQVLVPEGEYKDDTLRYAERLVKFLLWARGGFRLYVSGPAGIAEYLQQAYAASGSRAFDSALMTRIYEQPFEIVAVAKDDLPAAREAETREGGHLDGCRIGFDLGASDYKIAAVQDGEPVFCTELPWNPRVEADPSYHRDCIEKGLKLAASHLPRVDAIGGSSAGVYINNRPMVASLFRAVSEEQFEADVKPLFQRIAEEWNVPLRIINDGDVTALAGGMSLKCNAVLGIAMGSSEAVGYLDRNGVIAGWLNELAFAPVDFNPRATADEWSGDPGVGAMYFNQQAVNRLAPAAGFEFPEDMPLPERLVKVQEAMAEGHEGARKIYETIGVYLGYTIPYYGLYYDFSDLLILGRVTSGEGGGVILETARSVLEKEFPEWLERVTMNTPDERMKRVGQAVAAASLPALNQKGA
jgi:predicted NBD/HSP70 family sugar kinase